MRTTYFIAILILANLFLACSPAPSSEPQEVPQEINKGKELVLKMMDKVGSYDKLSALEDVSYTYIYRSPDGRERVSLEKYLFDGELSWAAYSTRELGPYPDQEGEVVQGFDGTTAWTTLNGELMDGEEDLQRARFSRKTNFYWFAMMQKLADPGLTYEYKGTQEVNGISYEKVEVGFGDGVGDAQDIYLLYINPETGLVDQFLFTVKAFGRTDPLLMRVEYEEVDGILLTVYRKYTPSNWEAEIDEDEAKWTEEISEEVSFTNGLSKGDFALSAED